jgi:hypothetical protein
MPATVGVRRISCEKTAGWRIMRISQNSSAFRNVRCVIGACERDRELQDMREAFSARWIHDVQLVKVRGASGEVEESVPCSDDTIQV